MSNIDIIDYRTKGSIIVFSFTLLMASKSTMVRNISVFEDLNIY